MKGEIIKRSLLDICQIVNAKAYTIPVLSSGESKGILYVPNKYVIGTTFASFVTEQKNSGFYLLSDRISDLLYCSFILNSGLGAFFMQEEGERLNSKGVVNKRKLEHVTINMIDRKYRNACNILELMIMRISRLDVEESARIVKDTTVSFLQEMRSLIGLEVYMNNVYESKQLSVLDPWTNFINENGVGSYKLKQIDDVFISFYKSISDPDNDIMDAMKKTRLFVRDLSESINNE